MLITPADFFDLNAFHVQLTPGGELHRAVLHSGQRSILPRPLASIPQTMHVPVAGMRLMTSFVFSATVPSESISKQAERVVASTPAKSPMHKHT